MDMELIPLSTTYEEDSIVLESLIENRASSISANGPAPEEDRAKNVCFFTDGNGDLHIWVDTSLPPDYIAKNLNTLSKVHNGFNQVFIHFEGDTFDLTLGRYANEPNRYYYYISSTCLMRNTFSKIPNLVFCLPFNVSLMSLYIASGCTKVATDIFSQVRVTIPEKLKAIESNITQVDAINACMDDIVTLIRDKGLLTEEEYTTLISDTTAVLDIDTTEMMERFKKIDKQYNSYNNEQ